MLGACQATLVQMQQTSSPGGSSTSQSVGSCVTHSFCSVEVAGEGESSSMKKRCRLMLSNAFGAAAATAAGAVDELLTPS